MIPEKIVSFIKNFSYGFLGTSDEEGKPNISIKGIADVDSEKIYFFDLFLAKTRKNLEVNSKISFFVIELDTFTGYQLKGNARMLEGGELYERYLYIWERKRKDLIIRRILENLRGDRITKSHYLNLLKPKYLIVMEVDEIYDLARPIDILAKTQLDKVET